MSQLEKSEPSQDKTFPITKKQLTFIIIVVLCIGISLPFIFSWLKQICRPARNDGLIEEISENTYDSFDKCPLLNPQGVKVKTISWNADTKKCIYEYKVDVD